MPLSGQNVKQVNHWCSVFSYSQPSHVSLPLTMFQPPLMLLISFENWCCLTLYFYVFFVKGVVDLMFKV